MKRLFELLDTLLGVQLLAHHNKNHLSSEMADNAKNSAAMIAMLREARTEAESLGRDHIEALDYRSDRPTKPLTTFREILTQWLIDSPASHLVRDLSPLGEFQQAVKKYLASFDRSDTDHIVWSPASRPVAIPEDLRDALRAWLFTPLQGGSFDNDGYRLARIASKYLNPADAGKTEGTE